MLRGIIIGAASGGILGVSAVTIASVVAPMPQPPAVTDAAPSAAPAPQTTAQAPNAADAPQASTPAAVPTDTGDAPDRDTLAALDGTVTAPSLVPQAGGAESLAAPAAAPESAAVDTASAEAPVLPNPLSLAPMAPQPADELSISTEPAQPPAPAPETEQSAFAEAPADDEALSDEERMPQLPVAQAAQEEAEEAAPVIADAAPAAPSAPVADTESVAAPTVAQETAPSVTVAALAVAPREDATLTDEATSDPAPAQPVVSGEDAQDFTPITGAPAQVAAAEPTTDQTVPVQDIKQAPVTSVITAPPVQQETPAETEAAEAPAQPTETPQPQTEADATVQTAQAAVTAPAPVEPRPARVPTIDSAEADGTAVEGEAQVAMLAPSARPQIGTPAVSLTDRAGGIAIRRPGVSAGAAPQTVAVVPDLPSDTRPIAQFAADFENPDQKPLMSIVLIDDGSGPTSGAPGIAALAEFPYALSFAVDAELPDAPERMALYRAEGFEVLAMVDLPQGAQARDAETTLNLILSEMPQALAVLEGVEGGLQTSRSASEQVSAILAATGHGLVTQNRGLNTMANLSRKEGVPALPIFRDFDGKDQTATVMRRFLDQAAFRAGQEGGVVMLGRLRPETITALLLWGLQDRASQVALAPVSAVLLGALDG